MNINSLVFPQEQAKKTLAEIANEADLIYSPIMEVSSDIDDGIYSSKFNPFSAISYGHKFGEISPILPSVQNDDAMHPYYFEAQKGNSNPDLFLAQISGFKEGRRFMQWVTNDANYVKTHQNAFNSEIIKVDGFLGDVLIHTKEGEIYRGKLLQERIL